MEIHIKSDSNNLRMNKIMCNKNVSSFNKKRLLTPNLSDRIENGNVFNLLFHTQRSEYM